MSALTIRDANDAPPPPAGADYTPPPPYARAIIGLLIRGFHVPADAIRIAPDGTVTITLAPGSGR
jgi:hypothetical protein